MLDTGAQRKGECRKKKSTGSPKLVRSGKLGNERSFQTVLRSLAQEDVELGLLHIQGKILQGDVVVASGSIILGASTNSGLSGWAAARELLMLKEATFQLHDFSDTNIGSLDQGLSIKLARVIEALPELPEKLEALSARVSINRMRAVDVDEMNSKRLADLAVTKYLSNELYKFEEKSMKWRAVTLWGFFAVASLSILFVYHP